MSDAACMTCPACNATLASGAYCDGNMNLEALGRTYHGGAPAPLQPGDLVTAADAPDGAPTWVGLVVQRPASSLSDAHINGRIFMRILGDAADDGAFTFYERTRYRLAWADDLGVRPLTDAEAVGLAEMLAGAPWGIVELWYDGPVESHVLEVGTITAASTIISPFDDAGGWHLLDGRTRVAVGDEEQDRGKALASRALIAYTIKG